MYKVMIVDDEPPLLRSVKRAVQKDSCPFEVVVEALNGVETLEKIAQLKPDVVFTDIKMPLMDGITLVNQLSSTYPDIFPVILSGYQDFDDAKAVMKAGAVDYLLKPLEPDIVPDILSNLKKRLDILYSRRREGILRRIADSVPVPEDLMRRYFDFDCFHLVLVRLGALAPRVFPPFPVDGGKLPVSFDTSELQKAYGCDGLCLARGRDKNEIIFLMGFRQAPGLNAQSTAADLHTGILDLKAAKFITTVYTSSPVSLPQLPEAVQLLYKVLHRRLVPGKSQVLDCSASI